MLKGETALVTGSIGAFPRQRPGDAEADATRRSAVSPKRRVSISLASPKPLRMTHGVKVRCDGADLSQTGSDTRR